MAKNPNTESRELSSTTPVAHSASDNPDRRLELELELGLGLGLDLAVRVRDLGF